MAEYTGGSSFWSKIDTWVDGTLITADILYNRGLHRVFDRGTWLYGEIVRRFTHLASTASGLPGTLTGSIDLSTLTYDGTTGSLNGLTLEVGTDTSGPFTVTFGTGGSAPTSPASVVSAINTATSSDPVASLTSGNLLQLKSVTVGSAGEMTIVGGTSLVVLGLTATTNMGATTGGDGASQIGCPAQGTLAAGSLKAQLLSLDSKSPGAARTPTTLPDSNQTLSVDVSTFRISNPAASRVHTFAAGTPAAGDGFRVLITRPIIGTSATITIRRSSTTTIAVLDAGVQNWVEVMWSATVGDWVAAAWSSDVSSIVAA